MEFKTFSKICEDYEKSIETSRELYRLGVDISELNDILYSTIHTLIGEIYGEKGEDWFSWFCLENEFGKKDWSRKQLINHDEEKNHRDNYGAHDENGNPIFHTIESAWEILEMEYSKTRKKP